MLLRSLDEKFWENVSLIPFHECWEWTGALYDAGYGRFHLRHGQCVAAHRYSFALVEPIRDELVLDHICRNRACVNPKHLRQVTRKINSTENSTGWAATNKAKTHCAKGHPYDYTNTRFEVGRGRACRACDNARRKNSITTKASPTPRYR